MKNISLFGEDEEPKPKKAIDKEKRNWENGFQKWSNNMLQGNSGNSYGACGYGSMCDYCENMDKGSPCVRALNEMLRAKRKSIDYTKAKYEDVWNGVFE